MNYTAKPRVVLPPNYVKGKLNYSYSYTYTYTYAYTISPNSPHTSRNCYGL